MIVAYTHLGLGDHIICNGLIRDLAVKHGRVFTFVKPHNYTSVAAMYDGSPVNLIVATDEQAMDLLSWMAPQGFKFIGHHKLNRSIGFDRSFYEIAGIAFERRWDAFMVTRNHAREINLMGKLILPDEYVFVHDDPERGYKIDLTQVPRLPVVRATRNMTDNILDWIGVIQHAKSVHCIESSFAFLIDSLKTVPKELVLHRYARQLDTATTPTYKLPWRIIE